MSDHSRFVALADRKIKAEGRLVTLTSFTVTGPSYAPVKTPVVTTSYALEVSFTKKEIDNGLAGATSKVFLMPALANITKDMTVTDGSKASITKIRREQPGEQLIMYRVITSG